MREARGEEKINLHAAAASTLGSCTHDVRLERGVPERLTEEPEVALILYPVREREDKHRRDVV